MTKFIRLKVTNNFLEQKRIDVKRKLSLNTILGVLRKQWDTKSNTKVSNKD